MTRPEIATVLLSVLLAGNALAAPADPVTLEDLGASVKLANGKISFLVGKTDATVRTLTLGQSPNLAGRGAYFAVANSGGRDGWDIHNGSFQLERNSPELACVSVAAQIGGVHFTQYYTLRRGDQGFYVAVLMQRRAGDPPERVGQIRWSCYLNSQLFNYQLVGDTEQGPIPDLQGAAKVQDGMALR